MLSIGLGKTWVPPTAFFNPADEAQWLVVTHLRLPRTLLAIIVGASLGVAGAVMQGYLRNPLADPGVLGVSTCAALGAVLSLRLGITVEAPWTLPLLAMTGAALAVILLMAMVGAAGSAITFILAGVMVSAVAGALTSLVLSLTDDPYAAAEIINWLMGALTDRSFDDVLFAGPFAAAGIALLLTTGRSLDALSLGEETARSLGVRLARLQLVVAIGVGAAVGACVAAAGVIGFVGLVVPHLLRPFVGEQPSKLLLPSALAGAALVLAADIAVRLSPGAQELKLGVAMALFGGPFFLAIL
ncbi:MAG: iron ABC transporter permease, partial [Pseudomonadota bacterium]|nr:iron ABC transporter permease [Pseudomonadota bacterium]